VTSDKEERGSNYESAINVHLYNCMALVANGAEGLE